MKESSSQPVVTDGLSFWEESNFELRDPYINTRMAIILEIDNIKLKRAGKKDISITFVEKKSQSDKLQEDVLKIWGIASTYILRPFLIEYHAETEKATRSSQLRRVVPESNLFLNLLVACADFRALTPLVNDVEETLEMLKKNLDTFRYPIFVEAIELLIKKSEWLMGKNVSYTDSDKLIDIQSTSKEIGIYPENPNQAKTLLVAIGTMDGTVEDNTRKAIKKYLKDPFDSVEQIYLIHTNQSQQNAANIKDKLDMGSCCQLIGQREFEQKANSFQKPIALFLTYYRREDITSIIKKLESIAQGTCVFTAETYSYSIGKGSQRPDTIFQMIGNVEDFF